MVHGAHRRLPARGQAVRVSSARWTGLLALPLLASACLPQEDLSEYSRAWSNQPAPDAIDSVLPDAGTAPDASLNAGAGGSVSGGGDSPSVAELPPQLDAGTDAAPSDAGLDGGASDAGPGSAIDAGATISIEDAGTAPAASCASLGGSLQPGTRDCFVVAATPADWQGAVTGCEALGMTLVAVTSLQRDTFITGLSSVAVWIGGRDARFFTIPGFANAAGNLYTWLDGSTVADLNWAPGEPDATANEFCIEKNNAAGGPWFEAVCTEQKPYICELTL